MAFIAPDPLSVRLTPDLPNLPKTPEQYGEWIAKMDASIRNFYADLAMRVQSYISNTATAQNSGTGQAVTAGAATLAVAFVGLEPDTSYAPLMIPNWGTTVWATILATTGFTANFGTVAPGGGGLLWWIVAR